MITHQGSPRGVIEDVINVNSSMFKPKIGTDTMINNRREKRRLRGYYTFSPLLTLEWYCHYIRKRIRSINKL